DYPQWSKDERYADMPRRWEHRRELDARLGEWTRTRTPEEVMHHLQAHGVAATAVMRPMDLLGDPHLTARDSWQTYPRKDGRPWVMFGAPWKFSDTPAAYGERAPDMGENNDYVFGDLLGLTSKQITDYVESEVIF